MIVVLSALMSLRCPATSVNLEETIARLYKVIVGITFICTASIAGEINKLSKQVTVKLDALTAEKYGQKPGEIEMIFMKMKVNRTTT
jgi:hypothetical protein